MAPRCYIWVNLTDCSPGAPTRYSEELPFCSVATSPGFGRLDQAVDAFQDAVVDFRCEPAQNPIPIPFLIRNLFFIDTRGL